MPIFGKGGPAIFGDRVLRCPQGHLFVSSETERLFGSVHMGPARWMQCPVDGKWGMCGNVAERTLSPQQIEQLQQSGVSYADQPAPAPPPPMPGAQARRPYPQPGPAPRPPFVGPPPSAPAPPPPAAMSEAQRIDALTRIKELLDSGVLNQEEFESEKRRILDS